MRVVVGVRYKILENNFIRLCFIYDFDYFENDKEIKFYKLQLVVVLFLLGKGIF